MRYSINLVRKEKISVDVPAHNKLSPRRGRLSNGVKFKIADIVFKLTSRYPVIFKDNRELYLRKYGNFIYRGKQNSAINISVDVVEKFPFFPGKKVFAVYEDGGDEERWRLWENKNEYVYHCPIPERESMAFVAKDFSSARAYVPPFEGRFAWDIKDILYDLMQVMLINYFAYNKNGLILHAAAVKDGRQAIVFAGKSGNGKSTTARLWHRYSKAVVLNDDRVIVRKTAKDFFAYSGPWHGEFGNSVEAFPNQARLCGLFVLEHAKKNFCCTLPREEAFRTLYPTLFSVFWNRLLMDNTLSLCEELIDTAAVSRLGFVKDKNIISFVRQELDERDSV
jgi:hypothetical protein